ncbi:hypothetical protein [Azospirillum sp. B506]|uniref:hypothetical protein n=1 Tax=Azospirillum sp. B506 TaxID=137721 RepID=UPI0011DD26B1|nr:hypothetical protein [Azospirillum sp. B506]
MMAGDMFASLVGALVSDAAAKENLALASVFGASFSGAIQALRRKRLEEARDILIEDVKIGNKDLNDAAQIEDVIACMLRYGRAAQEGAARLNLRLLALTINGMYSRSRLISDEFMYFSDTLSSLRREEAIILGVFQRHVFKLQDPANRREEGFEIQKEVIGEIVPAYIGTVEEFYAYCGSILRTGFLELVNGFGGSFYITTPILDRLSKYASIESALSREAAKKETEL